MIIGAGEQLLIDAEGTMSCAGVWGPDGTYDLAERILLFPANIWWLCRLPKYTAPFGKLLCRIGSSPIIEVGSQRHITESPYSGVLSFATNNSHTVASGSFSIQVFREQGASSSQGISAPAPFPHSVAADATATGALAQHWAVIIGISAYKDTRIPQLRYSAADAKAFYDWGGGHGVFTYFLLKGLRGEADYNKDTSVTLGELTSYLSQEVRRATKNAQSPTVAGRYDPALTIGR